MRTGQPIRCAIYRGGTSRGLFFLENDLPYPQPDRTRMLIDAMGAGANPQLDGLGGGTSTTSKVMIVGPSRDPRANVTMHFAQVGVEAVVVDWKGTCGNMTAGVAAFAVDSGLVLAQDGMMVIDIYSVNSDKYVRAHLPVKDGRAVSEGGYTMPGVRGTGARIDLEYFDPAGAASGKLLPTGSPTDRIRLADGRSFTVSIVDAGNVVVFCRAAEIGLRGTELPPGLGANRAAMDTLEAIRSVVAKDLGLVSAAEDATRLSPGLPKVGFVSAPQDCKLSGGGEMKASEADVVSRLLSMQTPHRSYMGAGGICTAVAAMLDGTVVAEACRHITGGDVRIGHPQGIMDVQVKAKKVDGALEVESATLARTARRIMDGQIYLSHMVAETGAGR